MNKSAAQLKLEAIELPNQKLSNRELSVLIFQITGQLYTFAVTGDMKWGEEGEVKHIDNANDSFYQLMPHTQDDGFFDWYCYHRDNEQFFETQEDCTLHLLFYRTKWANLGKPKPF